MNYTRTLASALERDRFKQLNIARKLPALSQSVDARISCVLQQKPEQSGRFLASLTKDIRHMGVFYFLDVVFARGKLPVTFYVVPTVEGTRIQRQLHSRKGLIYNANRYAFRGAVIHDKDDGSHLLCLTFMNFETNSFDSVFYIL